MKRVLIVEDNPGNLRILKKMLTKKDFDCITAENGQIGVETAFAEMPDIVLMDLHMPMKNGHQAIIELRADERTKALPILLLTADIRDAAVDDALCAGCDDFVLKPIDFDELLEKMGKCLRTAG